MSDVTLVLWDEPVGVLRFRLERPESMPGVEFIELVGRNAEEALEDAEGPDGIVFHSQKELEDWYAEVIGPLEVKP